MRFIVTGFAGAVKARESKLLADTVGVDSFNQKPGRGDLRPWRQPLTVATVPSGRKTIYRMGRDVVSDSDYWLSWSSVVHAIRGFLASDTTERTYFTGSGTPKVTDNTIGLTSPPYPTTARELGVPAPSTALTLTQVTPGTGSDETRFYLQTFVTDKGEESKPSAVTSFTCKPGAVINITGLAAVPAGNYGITLRRIYRTVVGSSNEAEFYRLLEIPSGDTTAQDNATAPTRIVLESNGPVDGESGLAWDMPPAAGKHLTAMWGGMAAMIDGRSVRVCEQNRPWAWPVKYEITPPDVTPVALAVWDKNLLVLSNGRPYVITGSIPSALGDDPIDFEQSCVSERGPATVVDGVCWPAPDGAAYWGARGPRILTAGLMLREDWQLLKPATMVGTQYEGAYMVFYEPTPGTLKAFVLDPVNPQGVYFLDVGYSAAYFDRLTDSLYVLDGTSVKKWDAGASFMTATFKSKVFRCPRPMNMGFLQVTATSYPVDVTITAKWVDDGGVARTVTQTRSVTSQRVLKLKGGFLADEWQIECSTAGAVQGIALADSMDEAKAT